MTPGSMPISIYRGDSYRWQFTLWQDPGKTTPADLTGVTAKAEIRTAPGGTLITSMDLTVVMPNIIQAVLPATKTSTLATSGGVWDLQLTYTNGDVQTVLLGGVTVTMDVTGSAALAAAAAEAKRLPGRPV